MAAQFVIDQLGLEPALAQPGLAEARYQGRRRLLAKASSSSIRVRPLKGLEKPVRLHEVRCWKER